MGPRLLVDGFALSDGSERRGIGTVLSAILAGLAECVDLEVEVLADRVAVLPSGIERRALRRAVRHPRVASREHDLRLPWDILRVAPDVMWSPGQHPPAWCRPPLVATLHDLTPLVLPHRLTVHDASRWRRRAGVLRRAARILADSRSSADQAIGLLGVDPGRIEVIHHGVDPRFSPGAQPIEDEPYLLHVGGFGPHKGVYEAAAALELLAASGWPHRLKIVGPLDEWGMANVRAQAARTKASGRVDVVGYVEDLPAVYRGASALVFSSRAEGFGLPLLEAMACGTPVIAFDNTSIPEVAGDAAMLVPDGDVGALAGALDAVLRDDRRRAELREAGLLRAARFEWGSSIAAHRAVFLEVAG